MKPARVVLIFLFCAAVLAACGVKTSQRSSRPAPARAMVASAHPLASRAGAQILEKGGNAIDAAVATAFALSVVEPYSSGLGGGGFMLILPAPGSTVYALDYRETAPKAATRDMYVKDGKVVPGLSTRGPLAVAVPGTVAGLVSAHRRFGSLPLAEVMAPAISLAEDGFTVDSAFSERSLLVLPMLRADPCAAAAFLDRGMPYAQGSRIKQPDLAATLQSIASEGPDVFYQGQIGAAIVEDLAKKGGIITREDLTEFQVRWREPVRGTYRGYEVVSMPPPSSGGVALIEMLNLLEGFTLAPENRDSANTAHILAEVTRRAFADRSAFLGDPAFVEVPADKLIDKDYAKRLAATIDKRKATPSGEVVPGSEFLQAGGLHHNFSTTGEGNDTTHLSVIDAHGGAVSLTQTVNTMFGSGVVACGTGVLLNNEMDDFASAPGAPNSFGLIQGEANAIAPGKIPLSSMTPTMLFKDGNLFLVIGSPGGPRIITTVLQVIVNILDFKMTLDEAVAAPRLHHQWLPDQLYLETGRLSPAGLLELKSRGHSLESYVAPCNAQGVMVLSDGLTGASDPRGIGRPEGI